MPFGPWELVIILVILVLIFGASRLSQVGGAVGKSVREFRSAVQDEPAPAAAPAAAAAPAPALPPVACPSCQAANPPGNKFCSTCGATMTAPPLAVAEPRPLASLAAVSELTATDALAADKDKVEAEQPAAEKPKSAAAEQPQPAVEKAAIDKPPPPRALDNTCPSCATVNPPGQPFCGQCGTRLTPAAA